MQLISFQEFVWQLKDTVKLAIDMHATFRVSNIITFTYRECFNRNEPASNMIDPIVLRSKTSELCAMLTLQGANYNHSHFNEMDKIVNVLRRVSRNL